MLTLSGSSVRMCQHLLRLLFGQSVLTVCERQHGGAAGHTVELNWFLNYNQRPPNTVPTPVFLESEAFANKTHGVVRAPPRGQRSWCSCFPRGCGCRSWCWADSITPARPLATAAATPFVPSMEPLVISDQSSDICRLMAQRQVSAWSKASSRAVPSTTGLPVRVTLRPGRHLGREQGDWVSKWCRGCPRGGARTTP